MGRNSDYQFVSTDTEALEALMISAYEQITNSIVRPASPEKLFIKWVASIVLQERVINNYTGNQNIPSRAEGENLDALGELFYTSERPQAKAAVCTMRFYISQAQNTAILVPAGTRCTDIGSTLIWETTNDAYIGIGETYVDVQIQCQTAGTIGNGYAVGQINTIVDLYDYYSRCTNLTVSDRGADPATDEEFYEIMRESMDAYSTAGPQGAYLYHAKAVSMEIADVAAIRPVHTVSKALNAYTLSGKKYVFLGGDTYDMSTLVVHPHGSSSQADPVGDYLATYSDGLLKIELLGSGTLSSATQVDVDIDAVNGGHVEIYILMDDGTIATETIKEQVFEACNDETVRPLTDFVEVKDPQTVNYNIDFTYYVSESSAISSSVIADAVSAAVDKYKAWQCGKLGRDINPSKLIGLLMEAGVKRVNVRSPVFTRLKDGRDGNAPQVAANISTNIVSGGAEDE